MNSYILEQEMLAVGAEKKLIAETEGQYFGGTTF